MTRYLVMSAEEQFYPLSSKAIIDKIQMLSHEETKQYYLNLLKFVDTLHEHNIYYGEVTIDNVLTNSTLGKFKITNFNKLVYLKFI